MAAYRKFIGLRNPATLHVVFVNFLEPFETLHLKEIRSQIQKCIKIVHSWLYLSLNMEPLVWWNWNWQSKAKKTFRWYRSDSVLVFIVSWTLKIMILNQIIFICLLCVHLSFHPRIRDFCEREKTFSCLRNKLLWYWNDILMSSSNIWDKKKICSSFTLWRLWKAFKPNVYESFSSG